MNDISIAIQGRFDNVSISNIDTYSKFGKVILGIYETDREKVSNMDLNCEIVYIPFPPVKNGTNEQNVYYHSLSSYHTIYKVETEFTIKVRSDEKYSNLQPIIDKIHKYPDKYVTNNVGFGLIRNAGLHPSDHMICSKTTLLKECFERVMNTCINHSSHVGHINAGMIGLNIGLAGLQPETVIFLSYLISKYGIDKVNMMVNTMNPRELMIQETDVVEFDHLGSVICSSSCRGERRYMNNDEMQEIYNTSGTPSIRRIEDV